MKGLSRKKGRDVTGEDKGQETAIFCAECVKKFDLSVERSSSSPWTYDLFRSIVTCQEFCVLQSNLPVLEWGWCSARLGVGKVSALLL
jgi:hypothetical protein